MEVGGCFNGFIRSRRLSAVELREMGSLKSLECEYPIIDSDFQNFCASHGIFSVEDILIHDLYMLVAFAEQQSTSERLKQVYLYLFSAVGN